MLGNPLLDHVRRDEPVVFEALKRAMHLMIDRSELIIENPRASHVTLRLRDAPHLVRQRVSGESKSDSEPVMGIPPTLTSGTKKH